MLFILWTIFLRRSRGDPERLRLNLDLNSFSDILSLTNLIIYYEENTNPGLFLCLSGTSIKKASPFGIPPPSSLPGKDDFLLALKLTFFGSQSKRSPTSLNLGKGRELLIDSDSLFIYLSCTFKSFDWS